MQRFSKLTYGVSSGLPGPGEKSRSQLGRTSLIKTVKTGCWLLRGAHVGKSAVEVFAAAGDWGWKGTCRTLWQCFRGLRLCSYSCGQGTAIGCSVVVVVVRLLLLLLLLLLFGCCCCWRRLTRQRCPCRLTVRSNWQTRCRVTWESDSRRTP